MRRAKKQKQAYSRLIRSNEPLAPWERLPVHELPEVQRQREREYKRRASLVKRIGESALVGYSLVPHLVFGYMSGIKDKAKRVEEAKKFARTGRGNEFAHLSVGRLIKIKEKRDKAWQAAGEKAEARFRGRHPNVAIREAELHKKWEEKEAERKRSDIFWGAVRKSSWAMEFFEKRMAYSFSKSIPTRSEGFHGNYQDLARSALEEALTRQKEDGSIPLMGINVERERFASHNEAGDSLAEIRQSEKSYVDGASTALWKLGFVEFDQESDLRYGKGRFNDDITWRRGENGRGVTASIAFDQDNELHQMLAPDIDTSLNPQIEATIHKGDMSLSVVKAATPSVMVPV
jgi:hypothetical protein